MPDPYFTGGFEEVYDLVQRGCRALLEQIRAEHALDPGKESDALAGTNLGVKSHLTGRTSDETSRPSG